MSLLKKIGTIAAAGILSLGFIHNLSADPNDVSKEAARYKNLFMIENPENKDEIIFRWKRNGDEYDARCIYEKKQMKNKEILILKLKKAYEDKNRDGKFDEDEI